MTPSKRLCFFACNLVMLCVCSFASATAARAVPSVGAPVATPSSITAGQATELLVTSQVSNNPGDPPVVATGVNLVRVNANGSQTVIGTMRDDGQGGDAAAGDNLFTLRITVTEQAAGELRLRVSAPFSGVLRRVLSPITSVPIVAATPTITLAPATLNLLTGAAGSLTVTLSSPAGGSGQVVQLAGGTAFLTVPPSVTVAAGMTQANFDVTAGTTAGTANIVASASGFTSSPSATVNVALRRMSVTVANATVGVGGTMGGTVTLTDAAPAGGVTVVLATSNGNASVSPTSVTVNAGGTTANFTVTGVAAGSANLTASAAGFLDASLASPFTVTAAAGLPTITISSPAAPTLVKDATLIVTGTVNDAVVSVNVNGVVVTPSGGNFTATIELSKEGINTVTATARNSASDTASDSETVTLDTTPPTVRIDAPTAGAITSQSTVTISGLVNDVVSGTVNQEQVNVVVNGLPATVSNRSFEVQNFQLVRGMNTIKAVATDRIGNQSQTQIQIMLQDVANQQRIELVSGNNQSGMIGTPLSSPLVVQLLDAAGNPLADRQVTFAVRRSDGLLRTLGQEGQEVTIQSDGRGFASVQFQLGTRTGVGNNQVVVTSPGFTGEVMFCFSSTPGSPVAISTAMVMLNTQVGIVNQRLPMPFEVIVTDQGGNPVGNVPVLFKVEEGGGRVDGEAMVMTNGDGKTSALFIVGPEAGIGNNIISASINIEGSTIPPVLFRASGVSPGSAADTRVSGVVLDNQNRPIPNVDVKIIGSDLRAFTDDQGRFTIANAPIGTLTLIIDGSTSTRPERFPFLAFHIQSIAGQDNTLGMPIFIPFLDGENVQQYDGTKDVVLKMKGVPGVEFTVFAGSARCEDGATIPGCQSDGRYIGPLSLSQVHADKVPMPPPNGTAPKVVWTLQPAGLHFTPPIKMQLPNTDGLPPGQVIEVFSFDHALEQFVSGGTARVSADGSVIVSDPGFGITVSGWGAAPPPPPPPKTCTISCDDGNECTSDSVMNPPCTCRRTNTGGSCGGQPGANSCKMNGMCMNGSCVGQNAPANSTCDDGMFCTMGDKCDAGGTCKPGEKPPESQQSVSVQVNIDPLVQGINRFLQVLQIGQNFNVTISDKATQKFACCEERKQLNVKNSNFEFAVNGNLKLNPIPIPGLAFDVRAVKIGVFVEPSVGLSVNLNGTADRCAIPENVCWGGGVGFAAGAAITLRGEGPGVVVAAGVQASAELKATVDCKELKFSLGYGDVAAIVNVDFFDGTFVYNFTHVLIPGAALAETAIPLNAP